VTAPDRQTQLQAEVAAAQAKLARFEQLRQRFPDLDVAVDRWRHERYTSALVNPIADQVELKHNCGCCADSPLEARPYIEVDGARVYARPDCYQVGEKVSYTRDRPYPDWQAGLVKQGISAAAIARVASYLDAVTPEPDADTDDDC
jgi:hypothetical protein